MVDLGSLFGEVDRDLTRAPADTYTFHETASYEHADVLRGAGKDAADDPENGREDDGRFTTESVAYMARNIRADERTARHGYVKMDIDDHCIDFIQFVGRYIGLSAIIPNNNVDISWTFKMQLPSQAYNFKSTKHGRLGFDPAGRMIFLGYCRQQTVWIAIVHESFFRPDLGDTAPPGTSSGHHVTRNQFRKFCLYLAACMSHLAIGDIYCRDPFADPDIPGQFERSTNIL